ncbi:uncharacterized protein zgc:195173 [Puntigrus tetrazona]|uniref:uncharacterized protein zgc:195173 n=1 Tax=Puntigrus tetrazona TaxID=1606681 RepID=UPI001C896174|nr:uncharacterized protein zgc:195173 [Puntigrus tetrazona]
MAAFLFLVLVSAGVFLDITEAQQDLGKLPDNYRKGVEMAVERVNSYEAIKSVFLFFKSLDKSAIDGGFGVSYLFHHFYLKATRCPKGAANPTQCAFRHDRPLIDCGICYKIHDGEIQRDPLPYVHCIHKPQLTQDLLKSRAEHCSAMSYANGSPSLLASKNP